MRVIAQDEEDVYYYNDISLVEVVEKNAFIFWWVRRHGGKFVYFFPFFLVNFFRFCIYTTIELPKIEGLSAGYFFRFSVVCRRRRPPI